MGKVGNPASLDNRDNPAKEVRVDREVKADKVVRADKVEKGAKVEKVVREEKAERAEKVEMLEREFVKKTPIYIFVKTDNLVVHVNLLFNVKETRFFARLQKLLMI
ncbi:MAG: hypothetical protein LBE32_03805 [Burkholderiales bacterium]|nr:hypothetical protein [Burkholderiales bacterium]